MAFARQDYPRRRLTADDVLGMVETGILAEDEPVELLRGDLIVVVPQGDPHAVLTVIVRDRLQPVFASRAHIRDHSPIRADDHSLPEPDVAVVRGDPRAYLDRTPRGPDTILVVEIAVTSQALDRDKAGLYAAAGVPVYWLIDVPRRTVTVHEGPDPEGYRTIRTLSDDQTLSVPETETALSVRDVLVP